MPSFNFIEAFSALAFFAGFTKLSGSGNTQALRDTFTALDKSQAIIEFDLDGNILFANENFLKTMGYSLDEVKGNHHSMFADPEFAKSQEYADFWKSLRAGKFSSGQYKRYAKGGKEVWIEASYNPVMGKNGKPYKVVKFATDITQKALENAEMESLVNAISRSQAVIHFELDGTILDANENFLSVMGYSLEEIKGKHHSMFAEAGVAESSEYKQFWQDLRDGTFQSGQYKRLGKGGKEIWIEASYNPIFDKEGNVFKVTKFATDLTPRKEENQALALSFEENVKSVVESVGHCAMGLQATSKQLSVSADNNTHQSGIVASATEELSASVNEISHQVTKSVEIVDEAVGQAQETTELVASLVDAAEKINQVTSLISDIAEQTNLLALNATIEAARAGDAGKGFAVVASEVKQLASETAKATDEISGQVKNIQNVSQSTATAIRKINSVISNVNEISTIISSAVEEQAAATQEVAANIEGVQTSSEETGQSAGEINNMADDLNTKSMELNDRVNYFLEKVKSM